METSTTNRAVSQPVPSVSTATSPPIDDASLVLSHSSKQGEIEEPQKSTNDSQHKDIAMASSSPQTGKAYRTQKALNDCAAVKKEETTANDLGACASDRQGGGNSKNTSNVLHKNHKKSNNSSNSINTDKSSEDAWNTKMNEAVAFEAMLQGKETLTAQDMALLERVQHALNNENLDDKIWDDLLPCCMPGLKTSSMQEPKATRKLRCSSARQASKRKEPCPSQIGSKKKLKQEGLSANASMQKLNKNEACYETEDIVSKAALAQSGGDDCFLQSQNVSKSSRIGQKAKGQLDKIKKDASVLSNADKNKILADHRALTLFYRVLKKKCEPQEGMWKIHGMKSLLPHHQLIGAGWMYNRETGQDGPSGGILADYMGHGKTVEALSCMVANPAPSQDKLAHGESQTTIVVCPKCAVAQWVSEVQLHSEFKSTAFHFTLDASAIHAMDVIVISYSQLQNLHIKHLDSGTKKSNHYLFQSSFYRIILDEVHEIKNSTSKTFKACDDLNGKYRWCLTATPTPNGPEELFSYLKFLRVPQIDTLAKFKSEYVGRKKRRLKEDIYALPEQGLEPNRAKEEKLRKLLNPLILMRAPGRSFLGDALVPLPPSEMNIMWVTLSAEEEVIYQVIEAAVKRDIKKKIEDRPEGHGSGNRCKEKSTELQAREAFIRFRQAVASPLLLEALARTNFWTQASIQEMKDEVRTQMEGQETPFIDQIERWVSGESISYLSRSRSASIFKNSSIDAMRETAKNVLKDDCPFCFEKPEHPIQAECGHIFCSTDLQNYIDLRKSTSREAVCIRCKKPVGEPKPYVQREELEQQNRDFGNGRKRGDDYNSFQPALDAQSTIIRELDANPNRPIPLSSKSSAIINKIVEWQTLAPDDKIILFTQFIDQTHLIARVLQEKGIEFIHYAGGMKDKDRDLAIENFKDENLPVRVLICSLKCGGVALNLTCANRVINSDPWWNNSVEQQAFGRVNRMGQTKNTYFVRVLAKDTIDARIFHIQQEKIQQSGAVLPEFDVNKRLSKKDLYRLIGVEDDGSQLLSDDDDEDEEEEDYDNDDPEDGDYKG